MRSLLICHRGADLDRHGLGRWLGSFTEVVGIIEIREPPRAKLRRFSRELSRVGPLRMGDVLAYQGYHRALLAGRDRAWTARNLALLKTRYEPLSPSVPVLSVRSPNEPGAMAFIRERAPDFALARCKVILKERVFSIPRLGTFVLHPGICPEYRNAHGCFWALCTGDRERVGATLLKVDRGVDTGPIYGYFSGPVDEVRESHTVIQQRMVTDNLEAIQRRLVAAANGAIEPVATGGRPSAMWGQPWLSSYLKWKIGARIRRRAPSPGSMNRAGNRASVS